MAFNRSEKIIKRNPMLVNSGSLMISQVMSKSKYLTICHAQIYHALNCIKWK